MLLQMDFLNDIFGYSGLFLLQIKIRNEAYHADKSAGGKKSVFARNNSWFPVMLEDKHDRLHKILIEMNGPSFFL